MWNIEYKCGKMGFEKMLKICIFEKKAVSLRVKKYLYEEN